MPASLNYVLEHGLEDLSDENLMEMLTFANAGASLITTRKGALRVMPTREEVEEFIAKKWQIIYIKIKHINNKNRNRLILEILVVPVLLLEYFYIYC
ncbi:MAG: hypothetical protein ACLTER_06445 [Ruminococcus sp.]